MIESEVRFSLSTEDADILSSVPNLFGDEQWVVDLTLGLTGATSMLDHGWVVRVRRSGPKSYLQYKASLSTDGTQWNEESTEVADPQVLTAILTKIGLLPGLFIERRRKQADLENCLLSLDVISGLGTYLEIEYPRLADLDHARRRLLSMGISTASEAQAYGAQMLDRLSSDSEFRSDMAERIASFLGSGETRIKPKH